MDTTGRTKSILKQHISKSAKKRRLSFAAAVELASDNEDESSGSETETEEDVATLVKQLEYSEIMQNSGDISEDIEINPICKSIRETKLGLCYIPSSPMPSKDSVGVPSVLMKDSNRNKFVTSLKRITSNVTKVLIVGKKFEGEKIKLKLLEHHKTQAGSSSLRWSQTLDITLKETPTRDDIIDTDYFIFLLHLYVLESFRNFKEILKFIQEHALLSIKGMVLFLSSQQGISRNIVSYESLQDFLDDNKLCYIQWIKPGKEQYLRLLNNIHGSVGYHNGVPLLNKLIFMRTERYEIMNDE